MADEIEENLVLNIEKALEAIDQFAKHFEQSVATFSAMLADSLTQVFAASQEVRAELQIDPGDSGEVVADAIGDEQTTSVTFEDTNASDVGDEVQKELGEAAPDPISVPLEGSDEGLSDTVDEALADPEVPEIVLPVDADTSAAEKEADALVSSLEGLDAVVAVEVDTTDIDSAKESLAELDEQEVLGGAISPAAASGLQKIASAADAASESSDEAGASLEAIEPRMESVAAAAQEAAKALEDVASAAANMFQSGARAELARFSEQLQNVAKAFGEALEESIRNALANIPVVRISADSSGVTTSIDEAVANADDIKPVGADATEVTSEIDGAVGDANDTKDVTADADDVTSEIDAAIDGADDTKDVTADASDVTSEIDSAIDNADDTKKVTADASDVTSEIDAAVDAAVDTVDVTVDVTADTSAAQGDIDKLADSLGDAGGAGGEAAGGLDATTAAAAAAGRASAGATGAIGKANAAIAGIGVTGAAAASGVGALVVGAGFLYNAAFENIAVTQAWERSLGPLGDRILDLDSGTTGFRGNLRQLAQDVGSSDEAVLLATQRFVSFQQASGLADQEIVNNTQNMAALAAQIRVTNPALGSMDEIQTALSLGLQRGGPRLQRFGLQLDANEIQARALTNTGKELTSELTAMDKTVAGLDIAMEQLQPSQAKVAEGMENVAIKSDRAKQKIGDTFEVLGAALVEPITEAMLGLASAFELVGGFAAEVFEVVGKDLVSAFRAATDAVRPIIRALEIAGDVLRKTGEGAEEAGDGISFAEAATKGFARTAIGFIPQVGPLVNLYNDVSGAADDTTDAVDAASEALDRSARQEQTALATRSSGWSQFIQTQISNQAAWYEAVERNTRLAGEAFDKFLTSATANIPSVTAEFQKLSADMGAEEIIRNLENMFAATEQWTVDMETQIAAGNTNIVRLMAELGPEKSAILTQAYDGDLEKLEEHLDLMYKAEANAQLRARQATVLHYLMETGHTEQGAQEIVNALGANLILEAPTLESVQAMEKVLSESKADAIAGHEAREVVKALRAQEGNVKIAAERWMKFLEGGIKDGGPALMNQMTQTSGEAKSAVSDEMSSSEGSRIGGSFMEGLRISIEAGGVLTAARNMAGSIIDVFKGVFNMSSPSRVMMEIGDDLMAGLAIGLERSEGEATQQFKRLAKTFKTIDLGAGMFTVGGSAGGAFGSEFINQRQTGLAGANISVTVPITVTAGMTSDDGRMIGQAVGSEVGRSLRSTLRMEGLAA